MLTAMSFVSIAVMVILCMRLRRHRTVTHRMWVKMMQQEFEIDRLRGLLGPNTVELGACTTFEPEAALKFGDKYLSDTFEKICRSFGDSVAQNLKPFIVNRLMSRMDKIGGHYGYDPVELHFRLPLVRADIERMTCFMRVPFGGGDIPILSYKELQLEELQRLQEVQDFECTLKQMHVDTDIFNDKARG